MFSKKATKIDKIFSVDLTLTYIVNVKLTKKILSIFVVFLENMNFTKCTHATDRVYSCVGFNKSCIQILCWSFMAVISVYVSDVLTW